MQATYQLSGFHSSGGNSAVDSWYGLYATMYAASSGPSLRDCSIQQVNIVFPYCSTSEGVILRVRRGGIVMVTEPLPGLENARLTASLTGLHAAAFASAEGEVAIQIFVHNNDQTKYFKTRQDSAQLVVTYTPNSSRLTLSDQTVTAGGSVTAQVTAYSSACEHHLTLNFGSRSRSWTLASGVTSQSIPLPLEWLDQIPNARSGTATLTLQTRKNSAVIGTAAASLTVIVPNSLTPSFTPGLTRLLTCGGAVWPDLGAYIQGHSAYRAAIADARGQYGAAVAGCAISGGGYSATAAVLSSGPLNTAGETTVTFRVTDTRGLSAEQTMTINVLAYTPPQVDEFTAWRTNSAAQPDPMGNCGAFRANWHHTALNGANPCTAQAWLLSPDGAETLLDPACASGDICAVTANDVPLSLSATQRYGLRLSLTDCYGTVTVETVLTSANFAMHFNSSGNSVAFGKACENVNSFEIASGRTVYLGDKTLLQTLADQLYPVGSLYMSASAASPAELFGGVWTQIKDRFLLAAGDQYPAGSIGGAASAVLTEEQLPAHSHTLTLARATGSTVAWTSASPIGRYSSDEGGARFTQPTGRAGSESPTPVATMPPYTAVYVWLRTA